MKTRLPISPGLSNKRIKLSHGNLQIEEQKEQMLQQSSSENEKQQSVNAELRNLAEIISLNDAEKQDLHDLIRVTKLRSEQTSLASSRGGH